MWIYNICDQRKLLKCLCSGNMPNIMRAKRFIIVIVIFVSCIYWLSVHILARSGFRRDDHGDVKSVIVQDVRPSAQDMVFGNHNATLVNHYSSVLSLIDDIQATDTSSQWGSNHPVQKTWNCTGAPLTYKGVDNILCMNPPTFLHQHKNPCWIPDNTKKLTCLPYFQVIGMDKSGSTDLFDKVAHHPNVLKNKGVLGKETQWWSWRRYGHFLYRSTPIEPFRTYLNYFDEAADTIHTNPNKALITGDGTPMDLWDMTEWDKIPQNNVSLQEPIVTTADIIRHVNPDVRLMAIFRDPIERLFSDYFFLGLGKMTVHAFHNQVINAIKLLHKCTRTKSLRACIYNRDIVKRFGARIHLGFYPVFLKDWFKVFPREQMFITRTVDYAKQPQQTLVEAFSFLDLPNPSDDVWKQILDSKKQHVTKRKKKAGSMLPETRIILERLYFRFNKELADMLHDNNFRWLNASQHGTLQ